MKKRAQLVMEFFSTYGWVILVIGVALLGLSYFGSHDPGDLISTKCAFPPGLYCEKAFILEKGAKVTVTIGNGMLADLSNFQVKISDCQNPSPILSFKRDNTKNFTVSGCQFPWEQKYVGFMNARFVNSETKITHNMKGSLIAKAD